MACEIRREVFRRLHHFVALTGALNDFEKGTTINVGLVQGGTAVNTVAARATAAIDVRFPTMNIMEKILGEVREICRCCELPGSECAASKVNDLVNSHICFEKPVSI